MSDTTADVLAELAELEDPALRAANEKRGDDHGVNLGKLRAVAKVHDWLVNYVVKSTGPGRSTSASGWRS